MTNTRHFGYWIFGKDMTSVNPATLKNNGVTDVFLNYYAFTVHGQSKVVSWIDNANKNNINVHIWVQCFYNGGWINPATTNLTSKLNEIKKYSNVKGVKGIHLDYLRYPGNANKTKGGTEAITNFVKQVRAQNKNVLLSCAIMPEEDGKYYYGQDINALKSYVDFVIPMQYKGNYEAGTSWLASTTKLYAKQVNTWSGLQTYKSDDDTSLLSGSELINDAKTCLNSGAKGVILFRYGLSPNINFKSLQIKQLTKASDNVQTISVEDIKQMAASIKTYAETNKTIPAIITVNNKKYSYGQVAYILSYAINNIKKPAQVFTVNNAPKPAGQKVNENILASDYKDVAKRTATFIESKKTCPNYVATKKSKTKLHPKTLIYMLARIIVYYYSKKTMPKAANANSSLFESTKTTTKSSTKASAQSTIKLKAYLTDEGCSGMGQCTGYYCGCNSLQQCFYRLTGIHVSESTIASVAGTTTDGTDHDGLNTAVAWFNNKYNKNIKITWKNFSDLGSSNTARWNALQSYINKGAVFCHIMYRNQWGHYEVPYKVRDDDLLILNSLGDSCGSGTYCGYIETRSKSSQYSYISGISQKSIAILTNG